MTTKLGHLVTELEERMIRSGIELTRRGTFPDVPGLISDDAINRMFELFGSHEHNCDHERAVEIPIVLVAPVAFQDVVPDFVERKGTFMCRPEWTFQPYFLLGVRITHDWVPRPEEPYEWINAIEAACTFAQHPRLGSVKSHNDCGWGTPRTQAYRCPVLNTVVVSNYHSHGDHDHHAAMCRGRLLLGSVPKVGWYELKVDPAPTPPEPPPAPAPTDPAAAQSAAVEAPPPSVKVVPPQRDEMEWLERKKAA